MKITRIEDVYTVPKTEAEWKLLGKNRSANDKYPYVKYKGAVSGLVLLCEPPFDRTEVPVDQFLELLGDKITPWRLLEVGFFRYESDHMAFDEIGLSFYDIGAEVHYVRNIDPLNINTFTELLQMMKFLGWKNEEE